MEEKGSNIFNECSCSRSMVNSQRMPTKTNKPSVIATKVIILVEQSCQTFKDFLLKSQFQFLSLFMIFQLPLGVFRKCFNFYFHDLKMVFQIFVSKLCWSVFWKYNSLRAAQYSLANLQVSWKSHGFNILTQNYVSKESGQI